MLSSKAVMLAKLSHFILLFFLKFTLYAICIKYMYHTHTMKYSVKINTYKQVSSEQEYCKFCSIYLYFPPNPSPCLPLRGNQYPDFHIYICLLKGT